MELDYIVLIILAVLFIIVKLKIRKLPKNDL